MDNTIQDNEPDEPNSPSTNTNQRAKQNKTNKNSTNSRSNPKQSRSKIGNKQLQGSQNLVNIDCPVPEVQTEEVNINPILEDVSNTEPESSDDTLFKPNNYFAKQLANENVGVRKSIRIKKPVNRLKF